MGANWLSPVINFDHTLDISMFYYPVKSKGILDDLRRKITEMEATSRSNTDKGRVVDPAVDIALKDAKNLQEQLVINEPLCLFIPYIIPSSVVKSDDVNGKVVAKLVVSIFLVISSLSAATGIVD